MTLTESLAARRIYELERQQPGRSYASEHGFEEWLGQQAPRRQLDNCMRCGAQTIYRDRNGGKSLECSVCDWVAVEVQWTGSGRRPEEVR